MERETSECHGTPVIGDVLAVVFSHLPFYERLMTVPLVCKAWRDASYNPACWRNVNMLPWFQKRDEEEVEWIFECEAKMEFLVKKVIARSCGQLEELRTTHCTDSAVEYIAQNSPSLVVLMIPDSKFVTDESATKLAVNCPKLQVLDLSDCHNISSSTLEAFGRNCKSLIWLGRNMLHKHFFGIHRDNGKPDSGGGDDELIVLSTHMANLKHLELNKMSVSDVGVRKLARGCSKLETVSLAGCTGVTAEALEELNRLCRNLRKFTRPIIPRMQVDPKLLPGVLFDGLF